MTALRGHKSNNKKYYDGRSLPQSWLRDLQTFGQGKPSDVSQHSQPSLGDDVHQEVGSGKAGSTTEGFAGSSQSILPTRTSSIPSSPLTNNASVADPEFNLDEWQGETIPGNFTDGTSQFVNDTTAMETPIEPLPISTSNATPAATTGSVGSTKTTVTHTVPPEIVSNSTISPPTRPASSTNTTIPQTTIPSSASNTTILPPPTTPSIPTNDSNNSIVTGQEDVGQVSGNTPSTSRPIANDVPTNSDFNAGSTTTQRPTSPPAEDDLNGGGAGDDGQPPEETYHDGQHPTADDDAIDNKINENPHNDFPASSPSTMIGGDGGGGSSSASPSAPKSKTTCGSPLFSNAVLTCHRRVHPVPYYACFLSIILILVWILRYCFCRRGSNGGAYDPRGEYRQVAAQYGRNGYDNVFSDELSQESDDIGFTDDMEDDSWGNSGQKVLELGTFRSTEQNGGLSLAEMNG